MHRYLYSFHEPWRNAGRQEHSGRPANLAFKNPHTVADDHGDPEELMARLEEAEREAAALHDQLKAIIAEALLR